MEMRSLIPHWFTAINMLFWGMALLWYADHPRDGSRMLDAGAKARFFPRLLLAFYYACVFFFPDFWGNDVSHFMGRAALNMVALSDQVWVLAEWWIQNKRKIGAGIPRIERASIGKFLKWMRRKAHQMWTINF